MLLIRVIREFMDKFVLGNLRLKELEVLLNDVPLNNFKQRTRYT